MADVGRLMELLKSLSASPEVTRWARGSLPRLGFHGSGDDIREFIPSHPNRKDAGWLGGEFHFSSAPEIASAYSSMKRGGNAGPNVMPVMLRMENPYLSSIDEKQRLMFMDMARRVDEIEKYKEMLRRNGHDSVMLKYDQLADRPEEYSVFDPNQIKSLFNSGDFSLSDNRVNRRRGGYIDG